MTHLQHDMIFYIKFRVLRRGQQFVPIEWRIKRRHHRLLPGSRRAIFAKKLTGLTFNQSNTQSIRHLKHR